ncbi:MAG: hydrolase 2, exosortase A system-associated [Propionivibrio sp.]|uniref:hydrolase 2, exosortase A system-associated n=1 Tax=Propionivibrio sp. TaxID=2212460 RepID=UPI0025DD6276|nr:hydrolase 2, exosortase A system-associated [Propionivibrio sp.]MBL0209219.1 hydrolase 2, exosortase A system-associated [Propionivibrio sp.]
MTLDVFFLPVAANAKATSGRRFCLFYRPDTPSDWRGAVVYVHPFAEEMNKSRRMAALQARALAAVGYGVLQIDLQGCGDSSGDFGDASWERWVEDVCLACNWLQQRSDAELWIWGLRAGGLLASAAASRIDRPSNLLLWQPVVSGKQFLQQFLRLKLAGEMQGGDAKGLMERLRGQLAQGQPVEIAGYRLSSGLASGLEQAELLPAGQTARIEWLELSARQDAEAGLSPLASTRLEKWQAAGRSARGHAVGGPAFWQTVEISECPALLEASLMAMTEAPAQ